MDQKVGTIAGPSGAWRGRTLQVDDIRTHYFDEGDGEPLVLLHGGEFGCCAEISWEYLFPDLVQHYRVIAPDWLGFGRTAKVHDFESGSRRRLRHMRHFLEALGLEGVHIVGTSMGGTATAKALARDPNFFPLRSLTLIGAGGFSPDNDARQKLLNYDCTRESMRDVLAALFHDPRWTTDEKYLDRRHELSLIPGAWEAVAASRFKNPQASDRAEFGLEDTIAYENINVPVMVIAGAQDQLKPSGYAEEIGARLRSARVEVIEDCGHSANIERADRVLELLLAFLESVS